MIIADTAHKNTILITVLDRYEIGSCGPIVIIFDACVLIILFIPCAPVNSSHDWSIYFSSECPDSALIFTNGWDDICARNHIAQDPKWCF